MIRLRRTKREPLIPLNISIITMGPFDGRHVGDIGAVQAEIDMLRVALLYGDNVEILSGAFHVWEHLRRLQDPDSIDIDLKLRYSLQVFDAAIDSADFPVDAKRELETLRNRFQEYRSVPQMPASTRAQLEAWVEFAWPHVYLEYCRQLPPELPTILKLIDKGRLGLRDSFSVDGESLNYKVEYSPTIDRSRVTPDVESAVQGLFRMMTAVASNARNALSDPQTFPMFDAHAGALAGLVKGGPSLGQSNIRHATTELTKGLFARLPTFRGATLDEILDIRSDLDPHVKRFQVALTSMAAKMQGVADNEFAAAVETIWFSEVLPEIQAIEDSIRENRYLNVELLQDALKKPESLVTMASGRILGATQSGPASVASLGVAAAGPFIAREIDRQKRGGQTRESRFFFLYELGRQLKQGGRDIR